MATSVEGILSLSGQRDEEGYRTYKVVFLVRAAVTDGPANVLQTPGLPVPGGGWNLSGFSDVDVFVWFRPTATIAIHEEKKGDPARFWTVEMTASNKPVDPKKQRCQDVQIEDPLLEPARISGSFIKYTEEAATAFGVTIYSGEDVVSEGVNVPILTSAHTQIRGPQVEFDHCRATVRIEQNIASSLLAITLPNQLMNTVNDAPLWGLPARCVKLSNASWERQFQGLCQVYYKRTLEFETYIKEDPDNPGSYISGFDRLLLDESDKVLKGKWSETDPPYWVPDDDMDPENPAHFMRAIDKAGNPIRVILNGRGVPWDGTDSPTGTGGDEFKGEVLVQKFLSANLLALGIPLTL